MRFLKRFLAPTLLISFSAAIAVVLLELGLRLILNPVDYLKPALVTDPVLGHRIPPGSAWHDAWGFRNHAVPHSADIVTIGDSMTYGNQALAKDAWPAVLGRLTEKSVYNMGLGGYGPLQYWYLMVNMAATLRPKAIIVGLYIGNDLMDASTLASHYDAWKDFRDGKEGAPPPSDNNPGDGVIFTSGNTGSLIKFLMGHSIVFRMLLDSPAGELIHQARNLFHGVDLGFVNFKDEEPGDGTFVSVDVHGKKVAVQNGYVFPAIDLDSPNVASGLNITIRVLGLMQRFCTEKGIGLIVVLIPTKDTVLAEELPPAKRTVKYARTVEEETKIRDILMSACVLEGIACLDVLTALRDDLKTGLPYFVDTENHPNKEGYAVIAASIARFLREAPSGTGLAASNLASAVPTPQ